MKGKKKQTKCLFMKSGVLLKCTGTSPHLTLAVGIFLFLLKMIESHKILDFIVAPNTCIDICKKRK